MLVILLLLLMSPLLYTLVLESLAGWRMWWAVWPYMASLSLVGLEPEFPCMLMTYLLSCCAAATLSWCRRHFARTIGRWSSTCYLPSCGVIASRRSIKKPVSSIHLMGGGGWDCYTYLITMSWGWLSYTAFWQIWFLWGGVRDALPSVLVFPELSTVKGLRKLSNILNECLAALIFHCLKSLL